MPEPDVVMVEEPAYNFITASVHIEEGLPI